MVLLGTDPTVVYCAQGPDGDPLIFADDFESGDTSAWSVVVGAPPECPDDHLSRFDHLDPVSPNTPCVAEKMQAIVASTPLPVDNVFMKTGASGTTTSNFLTCFTDPIYMVDLDGRNELQPSIDHFAQGNAGGSTPFERDSLAASVGRTATWAISGNPSPLDEEITAIDPRIGLIDFGTNDMHLGATYAIALSPFYESMSTLLDQLEGGGIVPVITGLNPRADVAAAARWVPTYDVVTRGLAEQRQLPYLSLYRSMVGLPDMGLLADGLHGNVYVDPVTGVEPCVFTPGPLLFNFNLRNLRTLELLDSVRRIGLNGQPGPAEVETWSGSGSSSDPFVIDRLPFTHPADTSVSPFSGVDGYPACSGNDMSGAEYWYRFETTGTVAIRIVVLDREGVDVDVFLISGSPDPAGCIGSSNTVLDLTVGPAVYHLVVDTYVSGGVPQEGPYVLAVLECEPGDTDCIN